MTLELVNEWGEISSVVVKDRRPIERVQPLLTNDKAPLFAIANASGYWTSPVTPADKHQHTQTLSELLRSGPVVVGFYCPCWGRYAGPFMESLTQLAGQVQQAGGQLVVFSNEHPRYLPKQALEAPMILVYDVEKTVAQQFGVYSELDPIWDRVSGISEEVYIPALYVVDQTGRIRHHFLDENFEGLTPDNVSTQTDVLDAVFKSVSSHL
jgi:peroxiredoxin